MIQCDYLTTHRKADTVVVNKKERSYIIIDIACLDVKEEEKLNNYDDLKRELRRLWSRRRRGVLLI